MASYLLSVHGFISRVCSCLVSVHGFIETVFMLPAAKGFVEIVIMIGQQGFFGDSCYDRETRGLWRLLL